jgi:hypothetical protein
VNKQPVSVGGFCKFQLYFSSPLHHLKKKPSFPEGETFENISFSLLPLRIFLSLITYRHFTQTLPIEITAQITPPHTS